MKKNINDLFDLKKVSALLESFYKSTGFVTAILDLEGKVLSKSGWRQICTDFHRIHPKTAERCTYSDTVLAAKMNDGEKYYAYTCLNGLTDVAVPLKINGQHIANLFIGQFFSKEPDIDYFKKQAKEFGFDEKAYMTALSKVPVIGEEKAKTAIAFLLQMTDLISVLGFEKNEQHELNKALTDSEKELKSANEQLSANNQQLKATEQQLRAANKQIAASEAKYRSITENSADAIFIADKEGNYHYANKKACEMVGYTENELTKMNLKDLNNASNKTEIPDTFRELLKTGSLFTEIELQKKDGTIIPVDLNAVMLPNGDLYGSCRDISERKKTEKAFMEKSEQFETIIKGVRLGWWDWDIPSGNEIYNDILTENLGYKLNEVEPHVKWWEDKIHPDDAKQVYSDLQEHFDNKTDLYQNKHRLKTKNGQWKWFHDSGKVVKRDKKGNPIRMIGTLQDIDFEERAQKKIKESLRQIEIININIPNIIWKSDIDKQGNFTNTYISDVVDEFLALPKATIKNSWDKYFSFILPYQLPEIEKCFQKGISNPGEIISFSYEVKKANAKIAWFSSRGRVKAENNKLTVYGSTIDITERVQAEQKLKESEENYSELVENMTNAVAIYQAVDDGENFVFKDLNNAGEKIENIKREELIGKKVTEVFPGVKEFGLFKVFQNVWRTGMPQKHPIAIYKDDRITAWRKNYVYKLSSGEIIAVYEDVSDRKIAERRILNHNRNLEYLLDVAQLDTVSIKELLDFALEKAIELTSSKIGYIFLFNEAQQELNLFSWSEQAMRECKIEKPRLVYKLEKTGLWGDPIRRGKPILINDYSTLHEKGKRTPPGHVKLHKYMAIPVIVDKKTVATIGVANKELDYIKEETDILTLFADNVWKKIKAIEYKKELIMAKEKAEESDRLKSAFLANMSHEIRTPMNGILGFADLLKKPDLKNESQQRYIEIIDKSGKRMLNIINDIIDISKIESGLMEVNFKETNINEQIEYLYTFFKPEAEKKGIGFSFKNSLPAKEASILTDREKVYAILTNLVKNALKFIQMGSIELGYVLKDPKSQYPNKLEKEQAVLEFYVKDTGVGIPKDRKEVIFERFMQADIEDRMAYQGAGLGLAITKAYVEKLGGNIWVESKVGEGSTFYFTLPYKSGTKPASIDRKYPPPQKDTSIRKLKILITEDDEISGILLEETLSKFGKELLFAKTGVEAVNVCHNYPDIDLIIMDIRMPEMDGYEATRQIRIFNKDVIIIAQTAYGLTGDKEKSMEAGCNDYISKPINKTHLQVLIQKYFGK